MAAITGIDFLDLLDDMLDRANLSGRVIAYYGFRPLAGQTEFIHNDFLGTGNAYLQTAERVAMSSRGFGYGASEVPNIVFRSNDAGTGITGTAVMQSVGDVVDIIGQGLRRAYRFNSTGVNLVNNGDFSDLHTGWAYVSECNEPNYCFSGGALSVWEEIWLVPNNDTLEIEGPGFVHGSFDIISGLQGAETGTFICDALRDSYNYGKMNHIQLNGKTGTVYFGVWVTESGYFCPAFQFSTDGNLFVVDNLKLYANDTIAQDIISGLEDERFFLFADNGGNHFQFGDGKNGAAMVQLAGDNYVQKSDVSYPYAYADIIQGWRNYSLSFWNNYTPEGSSNRVVVATWPSFQLEIRNGYYGLLCTENNTYTQSTVRPTGGWHNIQVIVEPLYLRNLDPYVGSIQDLPIM